MSSTVRIIARRQIEKRLGAISNANALTRPDRGWIKAIREAIGMPTSALARRMGVSQPRITAIEEAEAKDAITLQTLERAARALHCELIYVLKPISPLDAIVEQQALRVARNRLSRTRHMMALEAQSLDCADEDEHVKRLARELIERAGSKLWAVE